MNKYIEYLVGSKCHGFIFCTNESYNPCLQTAQGFVRVLVNVQAINTKGIWSEPNRAHRGYQKHPRVGVNKSSQRGRAGGTEVQAEGVALAGGCRENPAQDVP